jgi:hypothetical protein
MSAFLPPHIIIIIIIIIIILNDSQQQEVAFVAGDFTEGKKNKQIF